MLLAEARGCQRIDLYTAFGEAATDELRTAFRELVRRRAEGTPVAYLVGHREFYSLDFEVTPDVLIPRPETELLVVALLDHVKKRPASDDRSRDRRRRHRQRHPRRLRGQVPAASSQSRRSTSAPPRSPSPAETPSGTASPTASRSSKAISSPPCRPTPRFDFIVSNPPYVSTAEMAELAADVRDHEPHLALEAGDKGTDVIAPLIEQAADATEAGRRTAHRNQPDDRRRSRATRSATAAHFDLAPTLRDPAGHARVIQAMRR